MKKYFVAVFVTVWLLVCFTACGGPAMITAEASEAGGDKEASGAADGESPENVPALESATIVVQITGFVRHPGVYEVSEGTRLYQLVEMAGGFLEDAASDYINQVVVLSDGQHVRIPDVEEFLLEQESAEEAEAGLVDINKAGESELCSLPGIGPGKAASIIKYREENGGFSAKEDLMNVSGIGESTFKKLEDSIIVR